MNKFFKEATKDDYARCRCCQSQLSSPVVFLSNMPLTDDFIKVDNLNREEYLSDILIYECQGCGLVQNPADFDHERYYQDYQYSSGHSIFTKNFMRKYAQVLINTFKDINRSEPESVIEIGSGDGVQLQQFLDLGIPQVLGIEPSEYLANIAIESGVSSLVDLFGTNIKEKVKKQFDICLSSYTLDHVRNPIDYFETSYQLLSSNGIIAFEIHNLEKIIERTEFSLFEHEHTIYLTPDAATRFLEQQGFEVILIDPIPYESVRGNSLILIAKKVTLAKKNEKNKSFHNYQLEDLNFRIKKTIASLDEWIDSIPDSESLIGFGAGGRGVMTLAALKSSNRFKALFDTNYQSRFFVTPKTRIPIVGQDDWHLYSDAFCLVFSYGYFNEIKAQLMQKGFFPEKIISLANFFPIRSTS
jgi:SAM-dependent methyltransferase